MSAPVARLCEVDGCDRKYLARGLCSMHYHRWERHGSTDPRSRMKDQRERLMARVTVDGECWIWSGARNPGGYGVIGVGRRDQGTMLAHRLSYELHVGTIPEGLHIDHLCVRPLCVRPEHLEAVTQLENNRRERARIKAKEAAA